MPEAAREWPTFPLTDETAQWTGPWPLALTFPLSAAISRQVAHRSGGAVRLNVAHSVGRNIRIFVSARKSVHLPAESRSHGPLAATVVIEAYALHERPDMIPVAQGVLQTLEHNHADAFSQDKAIRLLDRKACKRRFLITHRCG